MLVERSKSGWLLTGVLDFEHALAGDPLLDLAKTFYFAPVQSDQILDALTEGVDLRPDWCDTFATYLTYHQLELWNLLAALDVTNRLPAITAELDYSLAAA
jgi:aminoglycoside phosphotransferase (APT) family kinase protein